MNSYNNLTDSEKYSLINQKYCIEKKSFADIAKEYGTYSNKILRDAKKLNITIRNKKEAQKNALSTGRHKHPTKGTQRSDSTKEKIGMSLIKNWENIDSAKLLKKKTMAKKLWQQKSEEEKKDMLNKANIKVREASKIGSKLEHFILNRLIQNGYRVDFHKEQLLLDTRLQIDIFLPSENIAIEVDGPSHFEPVWGEETLKKNQKYDHKKTGLIIGKGLKLIRIKQIKDFSKTRATLICDKLIASIPKLFNSNNNLLEIED